MCCLRLAANTGRKKVAKNRHLGTIAQLWRAISSQLRHISTIGKNLLSSNISSRCPHNMVNFGLLADEIVSGVWGTPGNFNGFRVLAALLHGTLVVGVSQTAAFNRGRHLYSAGRPSRWALPTFLVNSINPWIQKEKRSTCIAVVCDDSVCVRVNALCNSNLVLRDLHREQDKQQNAARARSRSGGRRSKFPGWQICSIFFWKLFRRRLSDSVSQ